MRIAAAQTSPRWGDPTGTTQVVLDWIQRAADDGCDLVAFGETFLSGYPFWVSPTGGARFEDPDQKAAYAYYLDAAVTLDGPEVARIVECVRDTGVFCYVGLTERGSDVARGTVWATLLAVDPDAGVVGAHRKLRPTYEERMVWGAGDGHGLRGHDVRDSSGADPVRVGGLNCWENWMPQARHAMYATGEDVHVSVWPGNVRNTTDITRFIALEGRVVSLAACMLLTLADIPTDFPLRDQLREADVTFDGGSAIAGPDGCWIVEPVADAECLVVADIDTALVRQARHNFDPTGHYSRPDVFDVQVNRRRLRSTTFTD